MNISEIANPVNSYDASDNPLSLKKAIKAYQDEMLTGLTEEEKALIEKLSKEYLEKNPIKTERERGAFNDFVKSLLKRYGFKGDFDEYLASMAGGIQSGNSGEQTPQASVTEQIKKSAMETMAARNKFLF